MLTVPRLTLLIACWFQLALPALALDIQAVEAGIFKLTNALRRELKLVPLRPLEGLDQVARAHSAAMGHQHFFDHTDPQGHSPFDRLALALPGLFSLAAAENIAMRSEGSENEAQLARELFLQWQHSPGHYANLIGPNYRHLGVGVALVAGQVYATQNFAAGQTQLLGQMPQRVPAGRPLKLRFEFLADFDPHALQAFLTVPDPQARFYSESGSYYTGGGPVPLHWQDEKHFEVTLPTDKGYGRYALGLGRNASFYDTPYVFDVEKASF